jgi:RNA polymerase sigma factor (sigma-70 family)
MTTTALIPTVHIVDDDSAVRESLALLLGLRGYATRRYASAEEFLEAIKAGTPGCVLLDLRMPGMSGLEAQAELASRAIRMPVIILTAHGDVASARQALKNGAFDFLEKPVDDKALSGTIDAALSADAEIQQRAGRTAAVKAQLERLTPRERQVLEAVVAGRHNREIAVDLDISVRTVEVYKARIMDKLQIERLPDLIRMAIDLGIGPVPGTVKA